MKQKYWLICIGAVIVVLGVGLFVPKANWGTVAIFLLCPAMHLFMMGSHGNHPPSHEATEGYGDNCKEKHEEKKV